MRIFVFSHERVGYLQHMFFFLLCLGHGTSKEGMCLKRFSQHLQLFQGHDQKEEISGSFATPNPQIRLVAKLP